MKIKDLVFELVNKGTYQLYRAKGVEQVFFIEENKNVNPSKWSSEFKSFSSFEDAVKWANAKNKKHFDQEIKKCNQMIKDWEVK